MEIEYNNIKITTTVSKNGNIKHITYTTKDIEKKEISYTIKLGRRLIENFVIKKTNNRDSIEMFFNNMKDNDINLLSNQSLLSVNPDNKVKDEIDRLIEIFIRGISCFLVMFDLNIKTGFLMANIAADIYTILSQRGLKVMRIVILFYLNFVDKEDKIAKYALDFSNRWLYFFEKGVKLDKFYILSELIIKYNNHQKIKNTSTTINRRLDRIEKILSIHTQ